MSESGDFVEILSNTQSRHPMTPIILFSICFASQPLFLTRNSRSNAVSFRENLRKTTYVARLGLQNFIIETSRDERRFVPEATFTMKGAPILHHRSVVHVDPSVRLPCKSLLVNDIRLSPLTLAHLRRSRVEIVAVPEISSEKIVVEYRYKHLSVFPPFRLVFHAMKNNHSPSPSPFSPPALLSQQAPHPMLAASRDTNQITRGNQNQ